MGVTTARDSFVIDNSIDDLISRIKDFCNQDISHKEFQNKYSLNENYQWKVNEQREASPKFDRKYIRKIDYRAFDVQYIYYQENLVFRDRRNIMKHLFQENYALNLAKRGRNIDYHNYFITNKITDKSITSSLDNTNTFPLYLYPEESTQKNLDGNPERTPNLDKKNVQEIAKKLGLKFIPEKEESEGTFTPIDLLDYIYAVLHSPSYREKYKEFLKIDFPRVPYPEDPDLFWKLVELGGELRQIHLLEHPVVEEFITTYPIAGSNVISNRLTKTDPGFIPIEEDGDSEELKAAKGKILRRYPQDDLELGRIHINEEQYFGNVPKKAWEFYIGGYQPAEKWLKDRRDRELSIDEIRHYQKIIVALMETDRLMQEIDEVLEV
jgi:predicted helicase